MSMNPLELKYSTVTYQQLNPSASTHTRELPDEPNSIASPERVIKALREKDLIDSKYLWQAQVNFPALDPNFSLYFPEFQAFLDEEISYDYKVSLEDIEATRTILRKGVRPNSSESQDIEVFFKSVLNTTFTCRVSFRTILNRFLKKNEKFPLEVIELMGGWVIYSLAKNPDLFDQVLRKVFESNGIFIEGKLFPRAKRYRPEMDLKLLMFKNVEDLLRGSDLLLDCFIECFPNVPAASYYYRTLFKCFLPKASPGFPNVFFGNENHKLDVLFVNSTQKKPLFATDQVSFTFKRMAGSAKGQTVTHIGGSQHLELFFTSLRALYQTYLNLYLEVDHVLDPTAANDKAIPRIISRQALGTFFPNHEFSDVLKANENKRGLSELFLDFHLNHHEGNSDLLMGFLLNAFLILAREGKENLIQSIWNTLKIHVVTSQLTHPLLIKMFELFERQCHCQRIEAVLLAHAVFNKNCEVSEHTLNDAKVYKLWLTEFIAVTVPYQPLEAFLPLISQEAEFNLEEPLFPAKHFFRQVESGEWGCSLKFLCFKDQLSPSALQILRKLCRMSDRKEDQSFAGKIHEGNLRIHYVLHFLMTEERAKEALRELTDEEFTEHFESILSFFFQISVPEGIRFIKETLERRRLNKSQLTKAFAYYDQGQQGSWIAFGHLATEMTPYLNDLEMKFFFNRFHRFFTLLLEFDPKATLPLLRDLNLENQLSASVASDLIITKIANVQNRQSCKGFFRTLLSLKNTESTIDPIAGQLYQAFGENEELFKLFLKEDGPTVVHFLQRCLKAHFPIAPLLTQGALEASNVLLVNQAENLGSFVEIFSNASPQDKAVFLMQLLQVNFETGLQFLQKMTFSEGFTKEDFQKLWVRMWEYAMTASTEAFQRIQLLCWGLEQGCDQRTHLFFKKMGEDVQGFIYIEEIKRPILLFKSQKDSFEQAFQPLINEINQLSPFRALPMLEECLKKDFITPQFIARQVNNFPGVNPLNWALYAEFTRRISVLLKEKSANLIFEKNENFLESLIICDVENASKTLNLLLQNQQLSLDKAQHCLSKLIKAEFAKKTSYFPLHYFKIGFLLSKKFSSNKWIANFYKELSHNNQPFAALCQADLVVAMDFLEECWVQNLWISDLLEILLDLLQKQMTPSHLNYLNLMLSKFLKKAIDFSLQAPFKLQEKHLEICKAITSENFKRGFELILLFHQSKIFSQKNVNYLLSNASTMLLNITTLESQFLSEYLHFLKSCRQHHCKIPLKEILDHFMSFVNSGSNSQAILDLMTEGALELECFPKGLGEIHYASLKNHWQKGQLNRASELFLKTGKLLGHEEYNEVFYQLLKSFAPNQDLDQTRLLISQALEWKQSHPLKDSSMNLLIKQVEELAVLTQKPAEMLEILLNENFIECFGQNEEAYFSILFSLLQRGNHFIAFFQSCLKAPEIKKLPEGCTKLKDFFLEQCLIHFHQFPQKSQQIDDIFAALINYISRQKKYDTLIALVDKSVYHPLNFRTVSGQVLDAVEILLKRSLTSEDVVSILFLLRKLSDKVSPQQRLLQVYRITLQAIMAKGEHKIDKLFLENFINYLSLYRRCDEINFLEPNFVLITQFQQKYEKDLEFQILHYKNHYTVIFEYLRDHCYFEFFPESMVKELKKPSEVLKSQCHDLICWMLSSKFDSGSQRNLKLFNLFNCKNLKCLYSTVSMFPLNDMTRSILSQYSEDFKRNFKIDIGSSIACLKEFSALLYVVLNFVDFSKAWVETTLGGIDALYRKMLCSDIKKEVAEEYKYKNIAFYLKNLSIELVEESFSFLNLNKLDLDTDSHFSISLINKSIVLLSKDTYHFYKFICRKMVEVLGRKNLDPILVKFLLERDSLVEKIVLLGSEYSNNDCPYFFKLIQLYIRTDNPKIFEVLKLINNASPHDILSEINRDLFEFFLNHEVEFPDDDLKEFFNYLFKLILFNCREHALIWFTNDRLVKRLPELYVLIATNLHHTDPTPKHFSNMLETFEIVLMKNLASQPVINNFRVCIEKICMEDLETRRSYIFGQLVKMLVIGIIEPLIREYTVNHFEELKCKISDRQSFSQLITKQFVYNLIDGAGQNFSLPKPQLKRITQETAIAQASMCNMILEHCYLHILNDKIYNALSLFNSFKKGFDWEVYDSIVSECCHEVKSFLNRLLVIEPNLLNLEFQLLKELLSHESTESVSTNHQRLVFSEMILSHLIDLDFSITDLASLLETHLYELVRVNEAACQYHLFHFKAFAKILTSFEAKSSFHFETLSNEYLLAYSVLDQSVEVDEELLFRSSKSFVAKFLKDDRRSLIFLINFYLHHLKSFEKKPDLRNFIFLELCKYVFDQVGLIEFSQPLYLVVGRDLMTAIHDSGGKQVYLRFWRDLMLTCKNHLHDLSHFTNAQSILNAWIEEGIFIFQEDEDSMGMLETMLSDYFDLWNAYALVKFKADHESFWKPVSRVLSKSLYFIFKEKLLAKSKE